MSDKHDLARDALTDLVTAHNRAQDAFTVLRTRFRGDDVLLALIVTARDALTSAIAEVEQRLA